MNSFFKFVTLFINVMGNEESPIIPGINCGITTQYRIFNIGDEIPDPLPPCALVPKKEFQRYLKALPEWVGSSPWSSCTKTCGGGTRTRTRTCKENEETVPNINCGSDSSIQSQSCGVHHCTEYQNWQSWSTCSATCESYGVQARIRACLDYSTNTMVNEQLCYHLGVARETNDCNQANCPIHGGWSLWTDSSTCSATCGSGATKTQTRTCDNPTPQYNGDSCVGAGDQTDVPCELDPCPVDGDWSSWTQHQPCDVTCGTGSITYRRTCTNPSPAHGGDDCLADANDDGNVDPTGDGSERQDACNLSACPVHGEWSAWVSNNDCSVTCGPGSETLSRTCTDPAPQDGGNDCVAGPGGVTDTDTVSCDPGPCPSANTLEPECDSTATTPADQRTRYEIIDLAPGIHTWSFVVPASLTNNNKIQCKQEFYDLPPGTVVTVTPDGFGTPNDSGNCSPTYIILNRLMYPQNEYINLKTCAHDPISMTTQDPNGVRVIVAMQLDVADATGTGSFTLTVNIPA